MDAKCKIILEEIGINFNDISELNGRIYTREIFIDINKYQKIKDLIVDLKDILSSTHLTCLHNNALERQKWPLLNLIRQILNTYGFEMYPFRKSNGYTEEGKKKFKRFYLIKYVNKKA